MAEIPSSGITLLYSGLNSTATSGSRYSTKTRTDNVEYNKMLAEYQKRVEQYEPATLDSLEFNSSSADSNLPPIIAIHGLYGSKLNWRGLMRRINKTLDRTIVAVDLRNHGSSQHMGPHNYFAMTKDILHFIEQKKWDKVVLMGHSMGGKVSMITSLLYPELVSSVIVEDMTPSFSELSQDFINYLTGLEEIHNHPERITNLRQADELFHKYEPNDKTVRQFILTNLRLNDEGVLKLRLGSKYIREGMDDVRGWPLPPPTFVPSTPHQQKDPLYETMPEPSKIINSGSIGSNASDNLQSQLIFEYNKPSLLVCGSRSTHINGAGVAKFKKMFVNSSIVELDTGHWGKLSMLVLANIPPNCSITQITK
ncbi:Abhydrolase domain-containing protein [Zancudomyces culisetae]|uniref:Abhydrolase domain-containing protein n=1 Tax=Zancudomyces culisetae TaxID=1213189 RepID=A0A1R1PR74_ZANCU|nr:Abhydrolase domain-containing protein [Zancudomyces culisetae]|eukprot:OMH83382.1 Abhydrolase domain-containing protein [Zancudomyces culisetae]